jgi:nucleoside-diphosphate-sugar epimerase
MDGLQARYRGKTVVVTGAAGYIGSALLAGLRDSGARVVTASRHMVPTAVVPRAEVIFHLAGNTSVYDAERDPDASFRSTVLPIEHMADGARLAGIHPRLVFASTATVYGLTADLPVAETTAPNPITTYDRHKREAEQRLESASPHLDGIVLRLSNVYGPSAASSSAPERGFLNRAIGRAVQGHDLDVYGQGDYVRDFVHIDDVVRALLLAGVMSPGSARCFNVASGVGTRMRDALSIVVSHAARVTGRVVAIHESQWPSDAHAIERRHFTASIDRIRDAMQWRPSVSLADGIARFVEHAATAPGCAR